MKRGEENIGQEADIKTLERTERNIKEKLE